MKSTFATADAVLLRIREGVAAGKPELFMLKDPAAESGLGGPASAIVINLTSVLRGLRF